jgi:formate dehydrogenase maturation protein FdhE
MKCSRCDNTLAIIGEYYDFNEKVFIRDNLCIFCNSAVVEFFYEDSSYKSDWIDFNG